MKTCILSTLFALAISFPALAVLDARNFGQEIPRINTSFLELTAPAMRKSQSSRACNRSLPIFSPGNKTVSQATVKELFSSIAAYDSYERHYQKIAPKIVAQLQHVEKQLAGLNQEQQEQLAAISILELSKKENIPDDAFKYIFRRHTGMSTETMKRYAQLWIALKLFQQNDYQGVRMEIKKIKASRPVSIKPHQLDTLDKETYFSAQTIDNIIGYLDYRTRNQSVLTSLAYLRDRPALLPIAKMLNDLEADHAMFGVLARYATEAAQNPAAPRESITLQWTDKEGTYTTFRFQNDTYTILDTSGAGGGKGNEPPWLTGGGPTDGDGFGGSGKRGWSKVGDVFLISGELGRWTYARYIKFFTEINSTDKMALFYAHFDPVTGNYVIGFGNSGEAQLTRADFEKINQGKTVQRLSKLFDDQKERALVLWESPFIATNKVQEDKTTKLMYALQSAYTQKALLRDSFSSTTALRSATIFDRKLSVGSDYTALISTPGFAKVKDFNLVKNLEDVFSAAGIKVVEYDGTKLSATEVEGSGVIVITGDSDEQLAKFIDSVGEKGIFKGKLVILNSCETPITNMMGEKINQQYGAVGVFAYEGLIGTDKIEGLMSRLATAMKDKSETKLTTVLQELIKENNLRAFWRVSQINPIVATNHA